MPDPAARARISLASAGLSSGSIAPPTVAHIPVSTCRASSIRSRSSKTATPAAGVSSRSEPIRLRIAVMYSDIGMPPR